MTFDSSLLQSFCDLIKEHSGLQIPDYRMPELQRALDALLAESGLATLDKLYRRLRQPAATEVLERLVGKMAVGETFFFRDSSQFQALEKSVLPQLIEQRRESRTIRIWSAACSTGEEPYSVAILLRRLLPDIRSWRVVLLATDVNPEALARAKRARYREWSLRTTPESIRSAYFRADDSGYELNPQIRDMVVFRRLNLVTDSFPPSGLDDGTYDLILCRNVLIYFDRRTNERIVERLYPRLSPHGLLLVSAAEHIPGLYRCYRRHTIEGCTFYGRQPAGPRGRPRPAISVAARPMAPGHRPDPSPPEPQSPAPPEKQWRPSGEAVVEEAVLLWQTGRREEALRILDGLQPSHPIQVQTAYWIARTYADRSRWERAQLWLDRVIERSSSEAQAHYLRGLIYHATDRGDEALASFRRTIYLDPTFVLAYFAQAGILLRRGENRRAAKALDNVVRLLQGRAPDEPVAAGEELTVGELLEMVRMQRRSVDGNAKTPAP